MYIIHYSSNKKIGYVWRGIIAVQLVKKEIGGGGPFTVEEQYLRILLM